MNHYKSAQKVVCEEYHIRPVQLRARLKPGSAVINKDVAAARYAFTWLASHWKGVSARTVAIYLRVDPGNLRRGVKRWQEATDDDKRMELLGRFWREMQ